MKGSHSIWNWLKSTLVFAFRLLPIVPELFRLLLRVTRWLEWGTAGILQNEFVNNSAFASRFNCVIIVAHVRRKPFPNFAGRADMLPLSIAILSRWQWNGFMGSAEATARQRPRHRTRWKAQWAIRVSDQASPRDRYKYG